MKRRKSVRFSTQVESTTFQLSDPPSPGIAMLNGKANGNGAPSEKTNGMITASPLANGHIVNGYKAEENKNDGMAAPATDNTTKEHLQLTREEAFFLAFGIGALSVLDDEAKKPIPTPELLELFRRYSYVPDPVGPADLRPDDKFLLNYAFYHKVRSEGWVPRGGIKFGVDWLLYHKGPAFDHAEYGVLLLPSYGHRWWKEQGQETPQSTWHQMHATMRALSQVFKTFRPVTIEIPPPPMFDAAMEHGIQAVLGLYEFESIIDKRFKFSRLRRADPNHMAEVKKERAEAMEQKATRKAAKKRRKEEKRQQADESVVGEDEGVKGPDVE
jgi:tRNA-splicing endonuclease subunit Sen2